MVRLASMVRWCGGWRERRARQRLRRRQYGGATVWLGRRRSCRLAVSRLVRWRLVAALLRPIRKALLEMVAAGAGAGAGAGLGRRQLVTLPPLNFPFVGTLTLPAVA